MIVRSAGAAALLLAVLTVPAAADSPPAPTTPGARAYAKCFACHSLEPGKNDLHGPSLHAIVGRRVAAVPGFAYSAQLKAFARTNPRWTPALLDRMIADPEALVRGTEMGFRGIRSAPERKALIDWLALRGTTARRR